MCAVSFAVGLFILKVAQRIGWQSALLLSGIGAMVGTAAELFSPSEYDTVTVPAAITAALLLLSSFV